MCNKTVGGERQITHPKPINQYPNNNVILAYRIGNCKLSLVQQIVNYCLNGGVIWYLHMVVCPSQAPLNNSEGYQRV